MECVKITAGFAKAKKKQVKHELDRMRQAEKKKRRLEKALATSAAIISELEKKKQKKKEEQDRLDSEGAAVAESVALHVLLGEDSDDVTKMVEGPTSWDHGPPDAYEDFSKYSYGLMGCSDTYKYRHMSSHMESSDLYEPVRRDFYPQYFGEGFASVGLSIDNLAAQAVSSLKIADDARVDAYCFNHMLRG